MGFAAFLLTLAKLVGPLCYSETTYAQLVVPLCLLLSLLGQSVPLGIAGLTLKDAAPLDASSSFNATG